MEIKTATLKHTCNAGMRAQRGRKATSTLLGEFIQAKYAHGKLGPRACDLPEILLAELNVTISYMKGWHAKEVAMKIAMSDEEASYKNLSTYLHLLKTTNLGILSAIHTTGKDGSTLLKYLFFAFGASIAGYEYLRKVIVIDGTHMKGQYGNYQIFPLGFGIVDSENTQSWYAAIYVGLRVVYPLAHHAVCSVYLFRNTKHIFKEDGLAAMVGNAARAYTVGDFRYWFKEIQARNNECAQYLLDIGLPHWTLAYFTGIRYNIMSSNISESLNAVLQRAMSFLIVIMVEYIRTMLMRWFFERREEARKARTKCIPEIKDILIEHLKETTDCSIIGSTDFIYKVNDEEGIASTMDLYKKICICRVFDVLEILCYHALATVGIKNVDMYTLIGESLSVHVWRKLWEEKLLPPPRERDSDVPGSCKEVDKNVPKTKGGLVDHRLLEYHRMEMFRAKEDEKETPRNVQLVERKATTAQLVKTQYRWVDVDVLI